MTFYLISTILPVTINPLDPVPVYRQLATILRARIERNEFPPRQPLPSESQLMGEYGVSRGVRPPGRCAPRPSPTTET